MLGRTIQLSFVRNKNRADGSERPVIDLENLDYDRLGQIATDVVKVSAIAVVAVGVTFFTLSTTKQVIVNLTNPANYK